MATQPMDWTGFLRQANASKTGLIRCQGCPAQWHVPKCYLERPSEQCRRVLEHHRRECSLPAGDGGGVDQG